MLVKNTVIDKKEQFIKITRLIDSDIEPDKFCFFDIETTGLEAISSALYLIGYMALINNELILTQLFADDFSDQSNLIREFQTVIDSMEYVVHFNGQTFDIPYLKKKGLDFGNIRSYDIYRELKPLKDKLGLSSMNQKSLEKYCGLYREDIYDGGQLIDFYLKYIAAAKINSLRKPNEQSLVKINNSGLPYLGVVDSEALKNDLLLHNYEDVEGMLDVAKLISLLPQNLYKISSVTKKNDFNHFEYSLSIDDLFTCIFNKAYSRGIRKFLLAKDVINLEYYNGIFTIVFNPVSGCFKQFFDNYKDYYYLPNEDKVIPKLIGTYLDKSVRMNATAETCYIPQSGIFYPVIVREEVMKKASKKRIIKELPQYEDYKSKVFESKHFFRESYNSPFEYLIEKEFIELKNDEIKFFMIDLIC